MRLKIAGRGMMRKLLLVFVLLVMFTVTAKAGVSWDNYYGLAYQYSLWDSRCGECNTYYHNCWSADNSCNDIYCSVNTLLGTKAGGVNFSLNKPIVYYKTTGEYMATLNIYTAVGIDFNKPVFYIVEDDDGNYPALGIYFSVGLNFNSFKKE